MRRNTIAVFAFLLWSGITQLGRAQAAQDHQKKITGPELSGRVSDKYVSGGCGLVIVCPRKKEKDTIVLIPVVPLSESEKNGERVRVTYHALKVHAKKGCGPGIPVQILAIRKE